MEGIYADQRASGNALYAPLFGSPASAVGTLFGAAEVAGITASGLISSTASTLSGEAVMPEIAMSGQMVGLLILGSLAGSTRKSYPTRRNVQTATR
jgi:hypothetical protein